MTWFGGDGPLNAPRAPRLLAKATSLRAPRWSLVRTPVFLLTGLCLGVLGCESACPQQATPCSEFRQLRLDLGASVPQSQDLAAYRLTVRYSTKQAGTGGAAGATGAAGAPGAAGAAGGSGAAGDSGAAGTSGAAGGGGDSGAAVVDLDGVQECLFTTPIDELSSFRCGAGPFFVATEAKASASCGFVPGPGISVGCSGGASVYTVLRTSAAVVDVSVAIERNTEAFAPARVTIPIETVYPDGPSCAARCEQGSATIFVDALLANPTNRAEDPGETPP
jgi:hypothetical protein